MKKMLTVLLTLLLALPQALALAAPEQIEALEVIPLCSDFDLDTTSYVSCSISARGATNSNAIDWKQVPFKVSNASSSTGIGNNETSSPRPAQLDMAFGTYVRFVINGVPTYRYVVSGGYIGSPDFDQTYTLNAAVDISSTATGSTNGIPMWYWVPRTDAGWINTKGLREANFTVQLDQAVITGGIDLKVDCRDDTPTAAPVTVFPVTNYTTFPAAIRVVIPENWHQCNAFFKIGSADDGGDLTTNKEKISVTFTGVR